MKSIREKKPILHAILWIIFYILIVNIGESFAAYFSFPSLLTILLLFIFSIGLSIYLYRWKLLDDPRICQISLPDRRITLHYLPLILLIAVPFAGGINRSLFINEVASICLMMLAIGFLEEVLFRGLLFQAIRNQSNVSRAIVISGITFGLGHIVNLFRGYGYAQLAGQILLAIVIGLVLATLVALTKNLLPGILFHALFNIGSSITNESSTINVIVILFILAIAGLYLVYLLRQLSNKKISTLTEISNE